MAYAPLIPGAPIVGDSNYTVYDSNNGTIPSGNKTKSPAILDSSNTWTGTANVSAQPTYKFLQSMNVTPLAGLDLGYGLSLDESDFEIKFDWEYNRDNNATNSNSRTLICCGDSTAGSWRLEMYSPNAGALSRSEIYFYTYNTAGTEVKSTFKATSSSIKDYSTLIVKNKQGYVSSYASQNKKWGLDTSYNCPTSGYNIKLFSRNADTNTCQGIFYYLKIWTKGELVHNYVPCIKYNSSGVAESIGIYDLVTYTYLTRNNSTELSNNLESSTTNWAYRQGISEEGFLYDAFAVKVTNTNTNTLAGVGVGGDAVIDTAYNAVWNDMTDLIEVPESTDLKFGKCYCFDGKDYKESSKYLEDGFIGIHSDTSGMVLGYKGEDKKHLQAAIAGFVLAYVDKEYPVGTPLTCGENGYLTELKKEDLPNNPHKLVGTFWKKEWSDWWGFDRAQTDNLVKFVDGRMWVKVR